jgi:hypothetical protein
VTSTRCVVERGGTPRDTAGRALCTVTHSVGGGGAKIGDLWENPFRAGKWADLALYKMVAKLGTDTYPLSAFFELHTAKSQKTTPKKSLFLENPKCHSVHTLSF